MAKSLSVRIAERAARGKPSRSAQNRAVFLAMRGDVQQALNDGWPVKTIWETLHEEGKVTFSYQAFRGYVNRLVLALPAGGGSAASAPANGGAEPVADKEAAAAKAATGFTFNQTPNKEDLL
jgi:Family of unknown function (DUF5338)